MEAQANRDKKIKEGRRKGQSRASGIRKTTVKKAKLKGILTTSAASSVCSPQHGVSQARLQTGLASGSQLCPRGTLVNVWRHVWLSLLAGGCHWHLVSRSQRCWKYHTPNSPPAGISQPQMSTAPRLRSLGLQRQEPEMLSQLGPLLGIAFLDSSVPVTLVSPWNVPPCLPIPTKIMATVRRYRRPAYGV